MPEVIGQSRRKSSGGKARAAKQPGGTAGESESAAERAALLHMVQIQHIILGAYSRTETATERKAGASSTRPAEERQSRNRNRKAAGTITAKNGKYIAIIE